MCVYECMYVSMNVYVSINVCMCICKKKYFPAFYRTYSGDTSRGLKQCSGKYLSISSDFSTLEFSCKITQFSNSINVWVALFRNIRKHSTIQITSQSNFPIWIKPVLNIWKHPFMKAIDPLFFLSEPVVWVSIISNWFSTLITVPFMASSDSEENPNGASSLILPRAKGPVLIW